MVRATRLFFALLIILSALFVFLDPFYAPKHAALSARYFADFFSYFTIQSNLFVALWFIAASVMPVKNQGGKPSFWNDSLTARGGLLIYGTVTAVVYWTMLASLFHSNTALGNFGVILLHSAAPVMVLIDLIAVPLKDRPRFTLTFLWLLYPLLYAVYTFVRGAVLHWYPYFFMDPVKTAPLSKLVLTEALMTAVFYLLGLIIFGAYALFGKKAPAGTN